MFPSSDVVLYLPTYIRVVPNYVPNCCMTSPIESADTFGIFETGIIWIPVKVAILLDSFSVGFSPRFSRSYLFVPRRLVSGLFNRRESNGWYYQQQTTTRHDFCTGHLAVANVEAIRQIPSRVTMTDIYHTSHRLPTYGIFVWYLPTLAIFYELPTYLIATSLCQSSLTTHRDSYLSYFPPPTYGYRTMSTYVHSCGTYLPT